MSLRGASGLSSSWPLKNGLDALDLLRTAVLLLDESCRIRHANGAAEELLGQSRRQLLGQPAQPWLDGRDSVLKTPLHGQPWAWLIEIPVHQGAHLDDLRQARGNQEAQRESLRNLAHEVRNPLAGLRAAAQLLEMELPRDDLREYTQVIVAEADRLAGLVARLASPSQSPVVPSVFNVHEVCERVLSLIRLEFGERIQLERDYDASVPDMRADRDPLLQALLNVARNGAQALVEAPETVDPVLRFSTRILHQPVLADGQHRMGLRIAVLDNGPGVPETLRDKLFHPLVTGRAQGTGLGLSLAQECLQRQGGLLEFDSIPGHTEFRLLLPLEIA
ncbi:MAG: histidine kinase dimerization/phospho-acceptor domain-containing protein [Castellaniella sp.]|uniref:two-component system sensor histidine kinase NtrB n=1 Tax=Castellaniella sp. TaxID=1955812 RepID=UPI002A35A393|nr:histidine kinase dimerization/phospho-acceptor domain-containing protein [Castellaniella sp.]MDY0309610.1 histidine kinase dimerization/phospho-acceptor domain-containing protein [Castellaniella sp.]